MRFILSALTLLVLTANSYALDLKGRVNDYAGVLNQPQAEVLDGKLAAIEELPNHPQVVLLTIQSLNGADLDAYVNKQFREWGIGQATHDNGILIFNAIAEHKLRIEVGYGLEGDVPDAIAKTIVDQQMIPVLKRNPPDYFTAYAQAIDALASHMPREATPAKFSSQQTTDNSYFWTILALIIASFGAVWWLINSYFRRQRERELADRLAAEAALQRKREEDRQKQRQQDELNTRAYPRDRQPSMRPDLSRTPQRPTGYDFDEPAARPQRPTPKKYPPIQPRVDREAQLRRERDDANRRTREAEEAAAASAAAATASSWATSSSSGGSSDSGWSSSNDSTSSTPSFDPGGGSSGGGGADGSY